MNLKQKQNRTTRSRSPRLRHCCSCGLSWEYILYFTLVFVVAATALRSSDMRPLRWADMLWEERKIRIVKSWKKTGVYGSTKTPSSERDVPMGRVLAHYLHEWYKQTPYAKPTDFVFPSMQESGKVPTVELASQQNQGEP